MRSTLQLACSCLGILCAVLNSGCQIPSPQALNSYSNERYPAKSEITGWIGEHRLRKASGLEIRQATTLKQSLRDARAESGDGRFSVSFVPDELIHLGNATFSSTSFYSVTDRSTGKELQRVPSTISKELAGENRRRIEQNVWFLPNGRILLNESWSDGCCPHDMVALVDPGSKLGPKLRYLALPEFNGYPGEKERGAYPLGIIGDWIIFNPLLSNQPFKMKLSEIPDAAPPLPFGIG